MANLYPTKRDRDGFFDFLPSLFDEWGHNFMHNTSLQPLAADVQEKSNAYEVKMDLPGFTKENIHIDYDQGVLTIDATRNQESNEKAEDGSFIRKERASGSYTRRFMLDGVKDEAIQASFKDGVLAITLPKKEESKQNHKEISIQ
ncbi:Hsp20/alpha crystallin family protein [Sporolactobacillus kofuensis]|uniref:Hsp20/alpha crystallin family protein n=1 Tax=Sporolactobacillus kofuensis TaxID=269672 RepID=A0ABW1WER8_9BACL|nr:Hsp20/alpha crystallin family protein [Sporolactobacillus kofuensis]MCO7176689.1 Hsp20/alpha crystallin family protein [Sporolactobacillus kofuensis]